MCAPTFEYDSAVHPRTCGEHVVLEALTPGLFGSSPHMRGTQIHPRHPQPIDRFIPAHAGNTAPKNARRISHPVHPRTCGEHCQILDEFRSMAGSSPHMRGTLRVRGRRRRRGRFIPAHAGNTRRFAPPPLFKTVHPRTCGEHSTEKDKGPEGPGSSPHMRGTQSATVHTHARHRFIPAHAGNTHCVNPGSA